MASNIEKSLLLIKTHAERLAEVEKAVEERKPHALLQKWATAKLDIKEATVAIELELALQSESSPIYKTIAQVSRNLQDYLRSSFEQQKPPTFEELMEFLKNQRKLVQQRVEQVR